MKPYSQDELEDFAASVYNTLGELGYEPALGSWGTGVSDEDKALIIERMIEAQSNR